MPRVRSKNKSSSSLACSVFILFSFGSAPPAHTHTPTYTCTTCCSERRKKTGITQIKWGNGAWVCCVSHYPSRSPQKLSSQCGLALYPAHLLYSHYSLFKCDLHKCWYKLPLYSSKLCKYLVCLVIIWTQ